MAYEVECKYRVASPAALVGRVEQLGGKFLAAELQVDTYYSHPCRDFAQTDEALRIRRVGDKAYITYKGPKVDRETKTRKEIELELVGDVKGVLDHAALLEALGFRTVARVTKKRQTAEIAWQGHDVEIALDDVDAVGKFVELETAADEEGLDAARRSLGTLAEKLGLEDGERRSYLELLLLQVGERDASASR
ncbi:MAG TPA: class IV adenylate cyclase [Pirellulales bacterium]|jgi:adenylate cyclase class 2|nr:class IV adenylate cyclase [Pirellulales bacterium]